MCIQLWDDGVSSNDYLERFICLIFLKMSDKYTKPSYKRQIGILEGCSCVDMSDLEGAELEEKISLVNLYLKKD